MYKLYNSDISLHHKTNTMKAQNKKTLEIVNVQYGANKSGNMRLWVNGKFYSDRQYSKEFTTIPQ